MSLELEKIFFLVLTSFVGLINGLFLLKIAFIFYWPDNYNVKFLRKFIQDKLYMNHVFAVIVGMSVLFVSFIPMYILVNVYPATHLDGEFEGTIIGAWGLAFVLGMLLSGFWLSWEARTKDRIQEALSKLDEDSVVLIEVADFNDYVSSESKAFHRTLKEKEVKKLRYNFEQVSVDYKIQNHFLKKYRVEQHQPPVVAFFKKDGSRVSIDGKDVFQGEDITSPERYASLLRKVLEKFSSEKIMRVRLTKAEFEYLTSGGFLPDRLLRMILNTAKSFEKGHVLELSDDDADEIRDLCGEHLQMVGFDENYDLTEEGEFLETFVDKFFIG